MPLEAPNPNERSIELRMRELLEESEEITNEIQEVVHKLSEVDKTEALLAELKQKRASLQADLGELATLAMRQDSEQMLDETIEDSLRLQNKLDEIEELIINAEDTMADHREALEEYATQLMRSCNDIVDRLKLLRERLDQPSSN